MGHEAAGLIETASAGPRQLEQGMPVVIDPVIACGRCASCGEGLPNLCAVGGLLGRDLDGVFTDYVAVPPANCHPFPDTVRSEDAPALQVLATVVRAHDLVHVSPGRAAAVVGLGFTGQLHAQLLEHRGARVLGVTRSEGKRRIAAELACTWVAAPSDATSAAAEAGPIDLVIECSGTPAGLNTSVELVRPGGTILLYGIFAETADQVELYDLYYKEITLLGTRASRPRDLEASVALAAAGHVQIAPLISDRLPFDAIDDALGRSERGALKVLVTHR